ncbi:hypothetical protein BLOT_007731 [Blomia tropicalis]|nr:hypothetical protein BLOT_007731 [Blomia tropicalis]
MECISHCLPWCYHLNIINNNNNDPPKWCGLLVNAYADSRLVALLMSTLVDSDISANYGSHIGKKYEIIDKDNDLNI